MICFSIFYFLEFVIGFLNRIIKGVFLWQKRL